MTTGLLTLLDLVKGQNAQFLIEETIKQFPEISGQTLIAGRSISLSGVGASRGIDGTMYPTLVTVEDPTVTFVDVNQGASETKIRQEERETRCFSINPRWGVGLVAAKRQKESIDVLMARQAAGHLRSAWARCAKCFYYGRDATFGDAKGFPGVLTGYDATNRVVDAAGTTDSVNTSVWLVKFGPEELQWVWGNNVQMELSDIAEREALDAGNKPYTKYHQEMVALPGLQFVSQHHAVRIKKINATDSGKGMTDDLAYSALEKFPAARQPNLIVMNRRSLEQLRASRTATNVTGAPAPRPTEIEGIPIITTDAIVSTETLLTVATT
jgi:hypothetical protein